MNKPALAAIKGKKGTMPADAIVVKENYMPDEKLAAITVMYKVAGYNWGSRAWPTCASDATERPRETISCSREN